MLKYNSDLLAGLFTMVITLVFFIEGRGNSFESNVFPWTLEAFLGLMSLYLLVRSFMFPDNQYTNTEKINYRRVSIMILSTILYIAGIDLIGFYTANLIYLVSVSFYFNENGFTLRAFCLSSFYGLVVTLSLYITFWVFLQVPTPPGIW